MLLEVFAQEALVSEVEVVGDLLDAFRGVFQQVAELKRHVGVDPLVGCLVADLLDDLGEILRGDAQLQGGLPDGVAGVVDERLEQALHGLAAEVVACVSNLGLDKREEVDDVLLLLLVEVINRVHT